MGLSLRPTTSAKPTDTTNGTFTRQDIKNLIHIPTDTIPPVTKIVVSSMLPCNNTGAVSSATNGDRRADVFLFNECAECQEQNDAD